MAYRTLEMTLVSAKDLKDVNLFSKMEVYAVASIAGDPRSAQRTPVDRYGGKNPSWNYTVRFAVPEKDLGGMVLHVLLRTERSMGDRDVGEVHVPLRELLDADSGKQSQAPHLLSYQVRSPSSGKARGLLNITYKFSDLVPAPVISQHTVMEAPTAYPPPASSKPYEAVSAYPPPPASSKPNEPATAYPPAASSKSDVPVTAYPAAGPSPYPPPVGYPPEGGYPPPHYAPPPQAGYAYPAPPPQGGYGGYPPPPQGGYGGYPPPQGGYGGYGYPAQAGPYGYGAPPPVQAAAKPPKKKFGMGLGAGLLGGAIGGMVLGDMVSDAADYDAGYDAGFDDGMGF